MQPLIISFGIHIPSMPESEKYIYSIKHEINLDKNNNPLELNNPDFALLTGSFITKANLDPTRDETTFQ